MVSIDINTMDLSSLDFHLFSKLKVFRFYSRCETMLCKLIAAELTLMPTTTSLGWYQSTKILITWSFPVPTLAVIEVLKCTFTLHQVVDK